MTFIEVWKEIIQGTFPSKQKEDKPMLNELKNLFKKEIALVQTCKMSAMVVNMLNEFTAETMNDVSAKDAAIDCVISLLQAEKSTPKKGA
jgi:hypothetical protein